MNIYHMNNFHTKISRFTVIPSNIFQILLNFMEIKYSTSIIFVPNLKEIEVREDGFHEF